MNGNEKINRGFCQDSNPLLSKACSYIAVKEFNASSARKVLRSESQDFSAHHYCSRGDASAGNSTHMMARAKYTLWLLWQHTSHPVRRPPPW